MALAVIIVSYLIGTIPTGLIVVRLLTGEDIRRHGSGNIGTVNVLRVAGTGTAVVVLAVDILKGMVPVMLAVRMGWSRSPSPGTPRSARSWPWCPCR